MRKGITYLYAMVASFVLCALVLFVPLIGNALWYHPCVNVYSVFGTAFFIMNTIGLIGIARGHTFGEKPYMKERPIIEEKKHYVTSVILAFFEAPLLLTVFFIDGGLKMVACTGLLLLSWILGSLIGDASANKLRKEFHAMEQKELSEQLRKEEGL